MTRLRIITISKIAAVVALSFLVCIFNRVNRILVPHSTERRSLREISTSNNNTRNESRRKRNKLRGNVTVDFYRTYQEKESWFGFAYKDHSIARWRIYTQLALLNFWYSGRVNFLMGDVYSLDNDDGYYNGTFVCQEGARRFSRFNNGYIKNASRVSVLVVQRVEGTVYGCVNPTNVPLGGRSGFAPAMVMGMSNVETASISWTTKGINNFAGITLAHEMGHILGYDHTALGGEESTIGYQSCGLDLRYPQFNSALPQGLQQNEVVWDGVTGERYDYNDWKGRTNIMSAFILNNFQLASVWKVGIFEQRYGPIFVTILDCWFNRSTGEIYTNETYPIETDDDALGPPLGLMQWDP